MSPRRAWVLNLDAELELSGPGYNRSDATLRGLQTAVGLLSGLITEDDVVLEPRARAPDPGEAAGLMGAAWCPTPRTLSLLRAAGAEPPAAPALDVLRRVNERAFGVGLDAGPLQSEHAVALEQVIEAVARIDGPCLLKRGLSFSGRGHRRAQGALSLADLSFCRNALQQGAGLVIEPWVQRLADFVQHGWVDAEGGVMLGRPLSQRCDPRGAWQATTPMQQAPAPLTTVEEAQLQSAATDTASALHAAGYFGPFGIDAFRYLDRAGVQCFRPLVEVNARYGMGWALSGLPVAIDHIP